MEIDFDKVPATASAETVADFRAWYKGRTGSEYLVGDDRLALEIPLRIADMFPVTGWPPASAAAPLVPPSTASLDLADRHCDDFYKAKYASADSGQSYSGKLHTVQYLARRIELTTPTQVVATPADTAQLAPAADTKSADYLIGYNDARAASIAAIMRMTP